MPYEEIAILETSSTRSLAWNPGIVGPHGTVGIGIEGEGSTTAEKIGRATAIYLPAMPPDTIRP